MPDWLAVSLLLLAASACTTFWTYVILYNKWPWEKFK
jgi:hypothetical protein